MSEVIEQKEVVETKKYNWELDAAGEYQVSNLSDLSNAIVAYKKAGLVPKQFATNEIAIGAYQYCKNLNLDPLVCWGQVTNIHGKFAPFGSLFTAIAQRDPDFGYDEVVYFDEDMAIINLENKNVKRPAFGCRVRTQKKGSPFIMETIFTMDDARKAGLIKNVWNTYPKDMLRWKCIGRNYRTLYPAALNGIMLAEDIMKNWDEYSTLKDVSQVEKLNERLGLTNAGHIESDKKES